MIPNNLNTASNLEILNLSHNQLQGKIPSALTELKKIKKAFLNNNYLVGELPRLDRLKETITTLNISNNYIANIDGKAAESETNRTIIHLLGEKIIALPQRELIVAQYSRNFGYTVNKFIKNLLPNRTYPLYIGKRSITSYQQD